MNEFDLPTEDIEDVGLKNTNPHLVAAARDMFKELQDQGFSPIITGGWRSASHNAEVGGVEGSKHTTGNALDLYCECPDGMLEEMAEKRGLTGFWHDAGTGMHFHLQNDDEADFRFINNFHSMMSQLGDKATNYVYADLPDMPDDIDYEELGQQKKLPSFLNHLYDNFMDSVTTTAPALVLQSLWGKIGHSDNVFGNLYQPITDDVVAYVKEALAGDVEAQEFCLLHGHDEREIRWLVNQKLVDKKRQADIQRWRAGTEWGIQKLLSYGAGGVGMLLDPVMWLPVGTAYNGSKLLTRLGPSAIQNVPKAIRLSAKAAEMGGEQAAVIMMDDLVRASNGEKPDFGIHAGFAFLGGAVMAKVGGFYKTPNEVAASLDKLETIAIEKALGLPEATHTPIGFRKDIGESAFNDISHIIKKDMANTKSPLHAIRTNLKTDDPMAILREAVMRGKVPNRLVTRVRHALQTQAQKEGRKLTLTQEDTLKWLKEQDLRRTSVPLAKIQNETHAMAKELHDAAFVENSGSKALKALAGKERVIATTAKEAEAFIRGMSGKELPKDAKAFYVPNEDYAFLLTDRVDPKKIDSVLAHEFAVHAGLRKTIGEAAYGRLLKGISARMNKEGDIFHTVRREIGTSDAEEVLAKMVEDDKLPGGFLRELHKLMGKNGLSIDKGTIRELLAKQLDAEREAITGLHFNEDGTTAFAGLQFSKDSVFNPNIWHDVYMLEKPVTELTQGNLKRIGSGGRAIAKWLDETTYFGRAFTSLSNTARRIAPKLFDDARGRGMGEVAAMSAETHKLMISRQLHKHYLAYVKCRGEALGTLKRLFSEEGARAFDKAVVEHYNVKYGKNSAIVPNHVPKEIDQAACHLHALREKQIEIGKHSSEMVGSKADNLIEKEWYAVDDEFYRAIDLDARNQLLAYYNRDMTLLKEQLTEYAIRFAKRDAVKSLIERSRELALIRERRTAEALGESIDNVMEKIIPPTEEEIEAYIEKEAAQWAADIIGTTDKHLDIISAEAVKGAELGDLNFFRKRLPMDTSGVMTFGEKGNTFEFSFDECLRSYDLDGILQKNINRFSGEAALKAVFGTKANLEKTLADVAGELAVAVSHRKINPGQKDKTVNALTEAIYELRGVRPKADAMTTFQSLGRLAQTVAYLKNGANMIFAQVGEVGGTMAYGGVKQIFALYKPLMNFVNDCAHGKIRADVVRQVEEHAFGAAIEAKVWGFNYGDRAAREALSADGIMNKVLRGANDFASYGAKVTSTLNCLPKLTDNMVRSMREQTIMDILNWAHGERVGFFRNPFSKAKLKAAHISPHDAEALKAAVRKYTGRAADGQWNHFDIAALQREEPLIYAKWYNLVEQQADRAIVNGVKIGNRNIFKDTNIFTRMAFQFKDYTARAVNGQTLRAMTAGDIDDLLATSYSIVTNTITYAARAGSIYAAMKAAGLDEKADAYQKRMFSDGALLRAVAFRSTIIGSPLTFVNDAYEIVYGAPSIRTTVDDEARRQKPFRERSVSDIIGDAITQLPAIKEAFVVPRLFYDAVSRATEDRFTERDAMNLLKAIPLPNFIPLTVGLQKLADAFGLPKDAKKKRRPRGKNWRNLPKKERT